MSARRPNLRVGDRLEISWVVSHEDEDGNMVTEPFGSSQNVEVVGFEGEGPKQRPIVKSEFGYYSVPQVIQSM